MYYIYLTVSTDVEHHLAECGVALQRSGEVEDRCFYFARMFWKPQEIFIWSRTQVRSERWADHRSNRGKPRRDHGAQTSHHETAAYWLKYFLNQWHHRPALWRRRWCHWTPASFDLDQFSTESKNLWGEETWTHPLTWQNPNIMLSDFQYILTDIT